MPAASVISPTWALHPALKGRAGVVVNMFGATGEQFDPNYIAGSTGNTALTACTHALGRAAPADGMCVVGVNPGPVATDRLVTLLRAHAERELGDARRWQELTRGVAFGRPAEPWEIAAAITFLASSRSGHTSGGTVNLSAQGRVDARRRRRTRSYAAATTPVISVQT